MENEESKKRAKRNNKSELKVNGSLIDVIQAAVSPDKKEDDSIKIGSTYIVLEIKKGMTVELDEDYTLVIKDSKEDDVESYFACNKEAFDSTLNPNDKIEIFELLKDNSVSPPVYRIIKYNNKTSKVGEKRTIERNHLKKWSGITF